MKFIILRLRFFSVNEVNLNTSLAQSVFYLKPRITIINNKKYLINIKFNKFNSKSVTTKINNLKLQFMAEVEDLVNKIGNIKLTNKEEKMEAVKDRRDLFLQNVKFLQPFDGDKNYLALFVDSVTAIWPTELSVSLEERRFYFNCITTTLRGPALNILRREQPSDWTSLKRLLIEEFGERTPVTRLILEISYIKFKQNVKEFCDRLNDEMCRIKDAIKLKAEDIATRNFLSTELNQACLTQLKKELPNYLTALINANLATDLKSAIKILAENGELEPLPQRSYGRNKSYDHRNTYHPNNNHQLDSNFRQARHFQTNSFPNSYPSNFSGNYRQNLVPQQNTNTYSSNTRPQNLQSNLNYPQYNYEYQSPKRQREYDSTQSRIRRYGAPLPMEVDPENFHVGASGNYQK